MQSAFEPEPPSPLFTPPGRDSFPKREYERVGLFLALLSPIVIPIGFWLIFMTPRPCNIDFCSGTVATAAGGTLLWSGIAMLGVGAGLLRAATKPQ